MVVKSLVFSSVDVVVQSVTQSRKCFVGGDFKGHIGPKSYRYDTISAGFGYGQRDNGLVSILDLIIAYKLIIVNSHYNKKEDHLVTFTSGT